MFKTGLKLWSINTDFYLNEAKKLYEKGVFDYIELYVVPNTSDNIEKWQKLKIPFAIHGAHFAHKLNFSKKEMFEYNFKLVDEVKRYNDKLNPLYTVFHPGIGGDIEETIRQMKKIKGFDFLVENKPYIVQLGEKKEIKYGIGASFEDIKRIVDEVNCGFCLDIGHSICASNYMGLDIYKYLEKMNTIKPFAYHISDNYKDSKTDAHKHFGEGTIDIKRVLSILNDNSYLAIETIKDSKENLDDFKKDVEYLKFKMNFKAP